VELDPNLDYAHWGYIRKREYEKGITHLQKAVTSSGNSPRYLASLGYAFAVAGRTAEAGRVLDKLRDLSKQRYVSPYYTATVYAGMGKAQRNLTNLKSKRGMDKFHAIRHFKIFRQAQVFIDELHLLASLGKERADARGGER